jgi:HK97 family phage major capsid protein
MTIKIVEQKIAEFENKVDNALKSIEETKIFGGSHMSGTSDEQKLLNSFGVRHVKELLEANIAGPRYAHVSENMKAAALQLKSDFDCARLAAQIFQNAPARDNEELVAPVNGILETSYAKTIDLKARLKAFSSTATGQGDEWVPTAISSSYIEELHLEHKLAALMKTVPMASNPFHLPVQTDSKKARLVGEGAAATDVSFGTEKLAFDAKKFMEYYILPEELNEDSAPAILELARREVVGAQIRAIESAIINGDLSATHMDSDTTGAMAEKGFRGLRKSALAASSTTSFAGGAVTKDGLNAMRKSLGKYGVNPRSLAWIFGPSVYAQAQKLDIVESLQNFGPNATVLTGALGIYNGISVLVSEFCREDLNASGVYDGTTTTMSAPLLVNLERFYLGMRRPIRVRAAMDARPEYDRWQLVSYSRQAFVGHKQAGEVYASGTTSTERSVAVGINLLS